MIDLFFDPATTTTAGLDTVVPATIAATGDVAFRLLSILGMVAIPVNLARDLLSQKVQVTAANVAGHIGAAALLAIVAMLGISTVDAAAQAGTWLLPL